MLLPGLPVVVTRRPRGAGGGATEHTFDSDHHDCDPMTPAEMFAAVDTSRSGACTVALREFVAPQFLWSSATFRSIWRQQHGPVRTQRLQRGRRRTERGAAAGAITPEAFRLWWNGGHHDGIADDTLQYFEWCVTPAPPFAAVARQHTQK